MAVKKSLKNPYTYQDLFDTQAALDSGELKSVADVATKTTTVNKRSGFLGGMMDFAQGAGGMSPTTESVPIGADKESLGTILGYNKELDANRKRRQEQQKAAGLSNSILGGGAF